jgi:hypothetical protein
MSSSYRREASQIRLETRSGKLPGRGPCLVVLEITSGGKRLTKAHIRGT